MLSWSTLFSAIALVFVIEGLMLFAGPDTMKKLYAEAAQLDSKLLRAMGLGVVIFGLIFLYFIRLFTKGAL